MVRPRHEHWWKHVTVIQNGWICNYCDHKSIKSGASRIEAHLTGKGGNIRRCTNYPPANHRVDNNMASTSTNPPQAAINTAYSTQEQGVNSSSSRNRSVCESEINQLNQLVLDLNCEKNDIANQLQCLECCGKKRKPEVDVWLEELQELKESVSDMMSNLSDTHAICYLIQDLKQHKEEKPLTLTTEYVGRKLDENIHKVLKLLDNDEVFVIGIHGMGGVGKTLLATLVEKEVKRKTTFKNVFWVTVSNNTNISKLQHDIAITIGVKLDEDNERIRAYSLSSALEKKEKSVLILDDVWRYIDLEKVGINPKVNGIKVILTTRLIHVCHQMDCQPYATIQIYPLKCQPYEEDDDDEDWELFMLKLGHAGTPKKLSYEIETIARCIVKWFKGLPLGIIVMARTMKGVDDIHQWKHALNKLKKLEMGQEVEEEVLKVLKRSYDNLVEKDLQNCFLYCALLSIDVGDFDMFEHTIGYRMSRKDELVMTLVDYGQINKNMSLEEIFDEGNTILNKLEAHSLISSFKKFIIIHPLMRSMASYILKQSKRNVIVALNERSTKIPLSHGWITDLELVHMQHCGMGEISKCLSSNCSKLSTLILNYVSITHFPQSFFEDMNSLSILDLSYNNELESLPDSISKLRSLVSLILIKCDSLKQVPPLGELQALSRLVISYTSIKEAPQGLEKLINLKWLDLSYNKSLNFELSSFSSYLTKLQYLDLRDNGVVITVEDVEKMNMLECFGGAIDCRHHNQSMQTNLDMSFELIKAYQLILRNVYDEISLWSYIDLISFNRDDSKNRFIEFKDCDHHFSHILPRNQTYMKIYRNNHWVCLCDALSYNTSSSLRRIQIIHCQQLEGLFCLSSSCSFCTNIHKLESLELECLESLTIICKEVVDVGQPLPPSRIFSCLKEIYIYDCHLIEKLMTPQLAQQLQNLETITIWCCNSMKEIFAGSNNIDNESSIIKLPKLTSLTLWNLPELKIVWKGIIRCRAFPQLKTHLCSRLEDPTIEIEDV